MTPSVQDIQKALDSLETLDLTLRAFIEENERQDISKSIASDVFNIRAVLSTPRAPVIDGLDDALSILTPAERTITQDEIITKAAKAYQSLTKGITK